MMQPSSCTAPSASPFDKLDEEEHNEYQETIREEETRIEMYVYLH